MLFRGRLLHINIHVSHALVYGLLQELGNVEFSGEAPPYLHNLGHYTYSISNPSVLIATKVSPCPLRYYDGILLVG